MSKLTFKYSTVNAGKTNELVRIAHAYREIGKKVLIAKPRIDTREGVEECIIRSRTGLEVKGKWYEDITIEDFVENQVILIDEAQFLPKEEVDFLRRVVYKAKNDIICFGLLLTFKKELFEGSKRLIELSDRREEIDSLCGCCGNKAKFSARYNKTTDEYIFDGDTVEIELGDITYIPLCANCQCELEDKYGV